LVNLWGVKWTFSFYKIDAFNLWNNFILNFVSKFGVSLFVSITQSNDLHHNERLGLCWVKPPCRSTFIKVCCIINHVNVNDIVYDTIKSYSIHFSRAYELVLQRPRQPLGSCASV